MGLISNEERDLASCNDSEKFDDLSEKRETAVDSRIDTVQNCDAKGFLSDRRAILLFSMITLRRSSKILASNAKMQLIQESTPWKPLWWMLGDPYPTSDEWTGDAMRLISDVERATFLLGAMNPRNWTISARNVKRCWSKNRHSEKYCGARRLYLIHDEWSYDAMIWDWYPIHERQCSRWIE